MIGSRAKNVTEPISDFFRNSLLPIRVSVAHSCFTSCLLTLAFFLLILSGCDDSFQPHQENDLYHFSIYGYLDSSIDTQWVRVGPPREQLNMTSEKPEMHVTLKHLQSDSTVVMHDTLVNFSGQNLLNAWTTMDIQPGHAYTLQAERPDGRTSQVSVTLPEDFPTPRLLIESPLFSPDTTYTLFIDGVDNLADVQSRWYIRVNLPGFEDRQMISFSYRTEAERRPNGGYLVVPNDPAEEMDRILDQILTEALSEGNVQFLHHQFFVASAGPEWNKDIDSMDDLLYTLPEGLSNVENGLGYMVGILSKSIPFESCLDDQDLHIACPEEKPFW